MTTEHFKSLILTFMATYVFVAVGRMLMVMSGSQNTTQNSPLHVWITGAGFAYMVFIFAGGAIPLTALWWGLFSLAVFATLVFFRIASRARIEQHSLAQILFAFFVLSPAFYNVALDVPMLHVEYTTYLKPLEFFVEHGVWGEGFSAFLLPQISASLMGAQWVVATPAILNLVVFALSGMTLARVVGVRIRWSNILLVSAVSLFAAVVFNPFLDLEEWLSVKKEILAAAALLVVVSPFCTERKVPYGFSWLPQAFALSFLVGSYAAALPMVLFIVALYAWRLFVVEKRFGIGDFFALILLITLPLISYYAQAGLAEKPWPWMLDEVREFPSIRVLAATVLCLLITVSSWLVMKGWKSAFCVHGWLTVPILLVLFLVFTGLSLPWQILQFVLLIPLWRLYLIWYEGSEIKEAAYASPWGAGVMIVLIFWGAQGYVLGQFGQGYTKPMQHVLNVSESWQETLTNKDRVAVLDGSVEANYSYLMDYKFQGYVQDETSIFWELKGQLEPFFTYLKEGEYNYLWLHSADDVMRENINASLRGDHSYLFKLSGNRLVLVKDGTYPHLSYTLTGGHQSLSHAQ